MAAKSRQGRIAEVKKEKEKKENFAFELRREAFHICLGLAIIFIALAFAKAIWILFFILIGGIIFSLASLYFKLPFIYYMLAKFERQNYLHKFPGKGALFFIAGCLIVLKLFSPDIALASIAILTFGDSFSPLFGLLVKNISKNKEKSGSSDELKNIEGAVVGIIAGTIAASFFVSLLFAFIASCIAMTAEFVGLRLGQDNVDDNFFVPLVAGTVLHLLAKFLA